MLTQEQKRMIALAAGNSKLEMALKRQFAERFAEASISPDKIDLKKAFEYENWRDSEEGKLDDFLFRLTVEHKHA